MCRFALGVPVNQRPNILFILGDNWAYPNAGILGDPMARTPAFDRVAKEGVLFQNTFNPVPSCSPTRACILTGRIAHQNGELANLCSGFPMDTPVVTQLLRAAGYEVAYSGKPWGPGNYEISGWKENPVGPKAKDFASFYATHDSSKPFFFWLGNTDTATRGGRLDFIAATEGKLDSAKLSIPAELPDCPEVRQDLMNYYGGVMRMDEEAQRAIDVLEKAGQLNNTVVVYTSDNGWQMPRGLANCYDSGSRVPLAIRWGNSVPGGRIVKQFVNGGDLGPTFLELAGLPPQPEMSMHSIKGLLFDGTDQWERDCVFIERERHANVRQGGLSYPIRGVRTERYLYLRNLRPDRWPAGDPDVLFVHGRPYGDVDTTRTKDFLLTHINDPAQAKFVAIAFGKRPAEELYDIENDPRQIENVAERAEFREVLEKMRGRLDEWMRKTADPRIDASDDRFDFYPYYSKRNTTAFF